MRLAKEAADLENPPEPKVKAKRVTKAKVATAKKGLSIMTKEDRDRAQARLDKQTRASPRTPGPARPIATAANKAVLDNMAKLKALRLAREAAEPPRVVVAKKTAAPKKKKADEPAPGAVRLAGQPAKWRPPHVEPYRALLIKF